jgi:D-alanyl-D-alanine carboxypeptidase/D-alanyl-D-alanine-endopeptidase (penicillin-binding protein 4)
MTHVFRRAELVVLMLFAGSAAVWAQGAPAGGAFDPANILRQVETFEKTHKARVGVSIVEMQTGRVITGLRGAEAMIPASNQKILTSAFALQRLGARGTFATTVYAAGKDVIVTGQFDPLLGDPIVAKRQNRGIYTELDDFVGAIRQAFGNTIPGDLILASRTDPAAFRPPSWAKRHHDRWFGAPVTDLNFHDNCFDVIFVEQAGGIQPVVTPASRYIRVLNELQWNPKSRHLWRLRESPDGAAVRLTGQIQKATNDPLSVPMHDPRNTLGRVLAGRLAAASVRVEGKLRILPAGRVNLQNAKLLTKSESLLCDVVKRANKRSLNLAAECMLLRAGDGTWAGSTTQMRDTLVKHFHLDPQTLVVADGSGLSRDNRVTPADMTKTLVAMSHSDNFKKFLASLPRNGVDGSLRKRLRQEAYRGRIAAKTGTLTGVRALSGYVLDADGIPIIAFSILANDLRGRAQHQAKQLQDQICTELLETFDSASR